MKRLIFSLFMVALMIAACGGDVSDANGSQQNAPTERPTHTPFPTFAHEQPTVPPQIATSAAQNEAEEMATIDPVILERGLGRYEALDCNVCHGEEGVGTDEAPALIGLTLSEEEFIDLMRSGGALGNEHQFSTDRLSARGGANLYQYLLSLSAE